MINHSNFNIFQPIEVDPSWLSELDAALPAKVTMAFRLDADEWNGVRRVKFFVEAVQA
jgi:single-stranded-DNA-specific exonuclease